MNSFAAANLLTHGRRQALANGHICQTDEKLPGRNGATPEAISAGRTKRIASENDGFSFYLGNQSSRKTAPCCLENLWVRAIEQRATIISLPESSKANHEKLYESQKRTELIQTTPIIPLFAALPAVATASRSLFRSRVYQAIYSLREEYSILSFLSSEWLKPV